MKPKTQKNQIVVIFILFFMICMGTLSFDASAGKITTKLPVIVVDPGHGGADTGVVGISGSYEKSIVLTIAKYVVEYFPKNYRVYITRDGDYALSQEERCAFANQNKGDLFISIHTGGAFGRSHNEIGVYAFDASVPADYAGGGASSGQTPEKRADVHAWDDVQSQYGNESARLAELLRSGFEAFLLETSLFNDKEKAATEIAVSSLPLLTLNGCDMPAVVVETGRLTTPFFEAAASDEEVLKAIARTIVDAVREFF